MIANKKYIKDLNLNELEFLSINNGQSKYTGQQLYEWLFLNGVKSFRHMTNINLQFRNYLEQNYIIYTLKVKKISQSKIDNSTKILFKTYDNNFIETVSMIENKRHTVCISSQVGCALDCNFCETGRMGLTRNLSISEIVDQLIYIRSNKKNPITNIVFMGMGEPFHNYNNVLNAADIFHNPKGFNLAATRITISTVGIVPKINQFIKEKRPYKLAISLNAVNDISRNKIMPINKKWPINTLINAGKQYSNIKKRQIMFEYVLIKNFNDSKEDAYSLSKLLNNIPCKLNIIPYNETGGKFSRPDDKTITEFSNILYENRGKYRVLLRWSKGQDINAGCGQLAINTL